MPIEYLDTVIILQNTLALVNQTRMHFHLTPYPEMPKTARSKCPLLRALEDCGVIRIGSVAADILPQYIDEIKKIWKTEFIGSWLQLPQIFRSFIYHFHKGSYPELLLSEES